MRSGRPRHAIAAFAVVLAAWAGPAAAQPDPPLPVSRGAGARAAPAAPSQAPVPSCLDQSIVDELGQTLRPRGVQKREFQKRGQLEILARGGLFAGDLLSSSYIVGGALAWFVTEDFGFEGSFDTTYVKLDLDKPLADFTGDDRFESGRGYLVLGNLLWAPVHAKMKMGEKIIHGDFLLTAGGGRLLHDSAQGVAFDGGLLFDLFLSQWVTMRFDLRDVVLVQEAVAETRLSNNLVLTGGLALWLPTGW